jgi:hypothetical protein
MKPHPPRYPATRTYRPAASKRGGRLTEITPTAYEEPPTPYEEPPTAKDDCRRLKEKYGPGVTTVPALARSLRAE